MAEEALVWLRSKSLERILVCSGTATVVSKAARNIFGIAAVSTLRGS